MKNILFLIFLGSCLSLRTYRDGEFVFHKGKPYTVVSYQGYGKYILQSEADSSLLFIDEIFIYE